MSVNANNVVYSANVSGLGRVLVESYRKSYRIKINGAVVLSWDTSTAIIDIASQCTENRYGKKTLAFFSEAIKRDDGLKHAAKGYIAKAA